MDAEGVMDAEGATADSDEEDDMGSDGEDTLYDDSVEDTGADGEATVSLG